MLSFGFKNLLAQLHLNKYLKKFTKIKRESDDSIYIKNRNYVESLLYFIVKHVDKNKKKMHKGENENKNEKWFRKRNERDRGKAKMEMRCQCPY